MRGTVTIQPDVLDVLRRSAIAGTVLKLPEKMERELYVKVDKVITGLGGKWDRRAGGHVFKVDPRSLFEQSVESGIYVDRKKALQFFETPRGVADDMVERAQIKKTDLILEPEAGHGAILAALPPNHPGSYVTAIDIDAGNCVVLRERFPTIAVHQANFVTWAKTRREFDVVLMNPPFAGKDDILHIFAAWDCLKPGGRLVAICADNKDYRQDRKHREFAHWLLQIGADHEVLPAGAFKESGTDVATRMIWARKAAA